MTTVTKEILTPAKPSDVWDAIRDIGALHTRLVPGFVIATELIPGGRRVTFGNGMTIDEPIVACDEATRRLVWTARGGTLSLTHYNSAVQVFPYGSEGSRVVWTADLLPNDAAAYVDGVMEHGASSMRGALASLASGCAGPE